eukprot:TRINITY_DN20007_c0_g1_i1.p1 TRINITY_DN20007_c0_g1~~TRINITY_DN20007_c0_g1_i1.p1  ORF type:complete len:333 (-),score=88.74 TRINITY_DN20007_c0_g1_i1:203-1201(-)
MSSPKNHTKATCVDVKPSKTKMGSKSKMNGWILYRDSKELLKPEAFEIHRLVEECEKRDIHIKVVSPEMVDLIVTKPSDSSIRLSGEVVPLPDFVIPRMGSATTYFAFAILRHLERLGVILLNSSHSIEIVKDKLYTQQILAASNLPFPKTMLVKYPIDADLVGKQIGFPLVMKTLSGSQGVGVLMLDNKEHFKDVLQLTKNLKASANIILQELVKDSIGRDLRVFIIGGRVVASMERKSSNESFKANFSAGGTTVKHKVSSLAERISLECARLLDLDVAGVDLLFDGDSFKICEVNSSPGFEGLEQAHKDEGLDVAKELIDYVKIKCGTFF